MTSKAVRKTLIAGAIALLTATGTAQLMAAGTTHANETKAVGPKLTPKLRGLLVEEMKSVKHATAQILDALVVGDHALVADMGNRIHESFILKQKLTKQDEKDLVAAVPPEFLKMDSDFHVAAKKLAVAAEAKDYELQRFYFGRLVESCQACHSQYVTDRFPAFGSKQPAKDKHAAEEHSHSAADHAHAH